MPVLEREKKQNVTVSLDKEILQKARILAACRSTSISGLLAGQIEALVGVDEGMNARRSAHWRPSEKASIWAAVLSQAGMNCMNDKIFVDTNILVYAHDADYEMKHAIASEAIQELWNDGTGIVSMQVLQEFYLNVTRKLKRPLTKAAARSHVEDYSVWCVETTPIEIAAAFRIEDQAKIGFWDALILAAALKGGASRILSEDLNTGQKIAGIRIENPFAQLR
jgi:predicted nucleic acid-binding protein